MEIKVKDNNDTKEVVYVVSEATHIFGEIDAVNTEVYVFKDLYNALKFYNEIKEMYSRWGDIEEKHIDFFAERKGIICSFESHTPYDHEEGTGDDTKFVLSRREVKEEL